MFKLLTRKRLAMFFGIMGIVLMGVDLMMTRNFFTHIGELMVASLSCFGLALFLNRDPKNKPGGTSS